MQSIPHARRAGRTGRATAVLATAVLAGATALAAATPATASPAGVRYSDDGSVITAVVPRSGAGPGYRVRLDKQPVQLTTVRGGHTVLASTADNAFDFRGPGGWVTATEVTGADWSGNALDLDLATSDPAATMHVTLTFSADRYRIDSTVTGVDATSTGLHFDMGSAGHWYGMGEATTDSGAPYTGQPWPLDTEPVADDAMGPAEYLMTDPFWFTQSAVGLYVDTRNVMDVSLGHATPGVAGFEVTESDSLSATVFVERNPHAVYADYIGIAGKPAKSDATARQYSSPLWNSWAQFYTTVTQNGLLDWARELHGAGVPGHTIQLDDGWMSHYGDFTFNDKFPDPTAMSDEIHGMGYDFGLWVTLWINLDADNYQVAADNGYLLRDKTDPSKPCTVEWWNGEAGIVDLGNPAARDWYAGKLHALEQQYGVDGFKFDTRFFDETCAPAEGHEPLDYLQLGAALTDEFDQQGAGVRLSWTGSQQHGFVIREVDKGTGWDSLQAAVKQDLSISSIGYPFVETDMIGGSLGQPPPTKEVLVRWAQAAALMPLVYSSTSPIRVYDQVNQRWVNYDAETAKLYTKAMKLHGLLAPYIQAQVRRAVATGEPIMKPLFFNYPSDQATYELTDEWLLGDSLLAAPVLTDATSRDIHVPPGTWFDVARHKVVHGPADLRDYPADLGTLPMFVNLGNPGLLRAVR